MIYIYVGDSQGERLVSQYEQYRLASELNDKGFESSILFDDSNRTERIQSLERSISKLPKGDGQIKSIADELAMLKDYRLKWFDEFKSVKVLGLSEIELVHATDVFIFPEYAKNIAYQLKETPALKMMHISNLTSFAISSTAAINMVSDLKIRDIIVPSDEAAEWIKCNYRKESSMFRFHVHTPIVPDYFKPEYKKPKVFVFGKNADDISFMHKVFAERYPSLSWVTFEIARNMGRREFARKLGESAVAVSLDRKGCFNTLLAEAISCNTMPIALASDFPTPFDNFVYTSHTIASTKGTDGFGDLCEGIYMALSHFLTASSNEWLANFEGLEYSKKDGTTGVISAIEERSKMILEKA